jgi:hypothetical protein
MSYMKRGENDKPEGNPDSRGSEEEGMTAKAVAHGQSAASPLAEPKNAGGAQGATSKNRWDGSGAKQSEIADADGEGKGM